MQRWINYGLTRERDTYTLLKKERDRELYIYTGTWAYRSIGAPPPFGCRSLAPPPYFRVHRQVSGGVGEGLTR